MKFIQGKYNNAKVFTDNIEKEAIEQLRELCNQPFIEECKVRIMPDTHKGAGCVIGFTADLGDKVIPNIVGVDIGCGMLTVSLGKINIDLELLDEIINKCIPSGKNTHEGRTVKFEKLQELKCFRSLKNSKRIERSIGTLGGGNHFIEVDKGEDGNLYLVIHSGSRNLGTQVADLYQNLAIDLCAGKEDYFIKRDEIIRVFKEQGRRKEIEKELKKLKKQYDELMPSYPRNLCFLTGRYREEYLHDMNICQEYATLNRNVMGEIILNKLLGKGLKEFESFTTIHNYINFKDNIIRKGSVSAYEGEKLLIPINMRDGSLICIGKGNEDWNYSAPHGAGRIMSRTKAKEKINYEEYKKAMEGIYSTSVTEETIDEAPMAYKSMKEIIENISESVDVIGIIKPIYNFKAQG
ncbi:RtcB family protein [Clostridium intestinale]|uniref:RtcB family protein n=1 Tax=Clostridium intestinale TaxID=36845 RepID=UPI002DD64EBB|nr:RtcB family protein [Clostridium intestinale]WRY52805.1 RtcB family protein [Clostridium intestinale]